MDFSFATHFSNHTEAVAQTCSAKKIFLEISQNSRGRISCEISKNTFSYRTPPVAASQHRCLIFYV